jgi:hypothetical protein
MVLLFLTILFEVAIKSRRSHTNDELLVYLWFFHFCFCFVGERERECVCVCVRARSSVAALTLVSTSLPLKYELTMVVGLKTENQGVVISQLQN